MNQVARTSGSALQRVPPIGMVRSSVDWSAGDRGRVLPRVDLPGVPRESERPLAAMTLAQVAAC